MTRTKAKANGEGFTRYAGKIEETIKRKVGPKEGRRVPADPVVQTLLDLGVKTVLLGEVLGVSQGTVGAYTCGFRLLPEKHRPTLYRFLHAFLSQAHGLMEDGSNLTASEQYRDNLAMADKLLRSWCRFQVAQGREEPWMVRHLEGESGASGTEVVGI